MSILQHLFSFTGRTSRTEWWGSSIGVASSFAAVNKVIDIIPDSFWEGYFYWIVIILMISYLLIFLWANLAIHTKRFHDNNMPGWYIIFGFIPILGQLWLLITLGFMVGTKGSNKFGYDPLE